MLALEIQLRHFLERLLRRVDFVVIVQGRCDQAFAVRPDEDRAHAPEQNGAGDGGDLRLPHPVP
uniref:hypothetical protein n=1 Tax=Agrobacterium genomosp. 6 TaxID=1183411 RepID=UPI001FF04E8B|nr:hypothetical protein [Agrobacterium genomosp. 6]